MKKMVLILAIVLLLASMFTLTASSTKPERVKDLIPLSNVVENEKKLEYDVRYPLGLRRVVQPLVVPDLVVHGTFGR